MKFTNNESNHYINPFNAQAIQKSLIEWIEDKHRDFKYLFLLTYTQKEYSLQNVEKDLSSLQIRLSNDIFGRKRNVNNPNENVSFIGFIETHTDGSLHVHVLMEAFGTKAKDIFHAHKKRFNISRQKGLSKLVTYHWVRVQVNNGRRRKYTPYDSITERNKRIKRVQKRERKISQKLNRKRAWVMARIKNLHQLYKDKKIFEAKTSSIKPKIIEHEGKKFIEVVVEKIRKDGCTGLYSYFTKKGKYNLEAVSYMNLSKICAHP